MLATQCLAQEMFHLPKSNFTESEWEFGQGPFLQKSPLCWRIQFQS